MNKLWGILELIELLIMLISIPLFIISFIINVICSVAGFNETIVFEITDYILSFILNYVILIYALLFVFNGLHAVDYLLNKHDLNK